MAQLPSRRAGTPQSKTRLAAPEGLALLAVGAAYFLLTVVFVGIHLGFSHDETVYLSQVDPSVPNFTWNAWRAWGAPVLFSPVAVFSPGLGAVRLYASAVSSIGLVLAFLPWLKILRSYAVALAAFLFATCWIAVYYGNDVQPNLYVALGAVAAVGLFVRAATDRTARWLPFALLTAVFLVALLRPSDGFLVAAPLGLACLVYPPLRRPLLLLPLAAGVVLGWLPWVIESFYRFGGPIHRYRVSNAHEAVGGLHPNLHTADIYLRILNGPIYGYRATFSRLGPRPPVVVLAVVMVVALVVVGLVKARRLEVFPAVVMTLASAGLLVVFYVFLLGYGGVRFLLPIIALVAIPVAIAMVSLVRTRPRWAGLLATAVVVALLIGDVGVQLWTAHKILGPDRQARGTYLPVGKRIRELGVHQPCYVFGSIDPTPTAFWARCKAGVQATGSDAFGPSFTRRVQRALSSGATVVVATRAHNLPAYFAGWQRYDVPASPDGRIAVWISPTAAH